MTPELPFEWFMLLLRILLIFLLYFFVFQVIRVISSELRAAANRQSPQPQRLEVHGSLLVNDSGDSQLHPGEMIQLDPVTVIGRNRRATIHIDSSFVSAEHAQLAWDRERWWATDLHSTNGTYVNSYRIDGPTELEIGDHLQVGSVTFQLVP